MHLWHHSYRHILQDLLICKDRLYLFCRHLWGKSAVYFIKSKQTLKVPVQDCGLWENLICTREQRSCGGTHQCTHSRMRSISILHHIDPRVHWHSPPWTVWMVCEWRWIALSLRILPERMFSCSFSLSVCLLPLGSSPCLASTWRKRLGIIGCFSTADKMSMKCHFEYQIMKDNLLVFGHQNFKNGSASHWEKLYGWKNDRQEDIKPSSKMENLLSI